MSQSSEQSLGFDLYINKNQIGFFQQKTKAEFKNEMTYHFEIDFLDYYRKYWFNILGNWTSLCVGLGYPINGYSYIEDQKLNSDFYLETKTTEGYSLNFEIRYMTITFNNNFDVIYGLRSTNLIFRNYKNDLISLDTDIKIKSLVAIAGFGIGF